MLRRLRNPWTLSVLIVLSLAVWMLSGQLPSATSRGDGESAGTLPRGASPSPGTVREDGLRLTTVQFLEQEAEPVERQLELSARTEASRVVEVKAQTEGQVVQTVALRGHRLAEGEVVLRLDVADREVRLTEAKARVRQRELEYAAQKALKPAGYNSEANLAEALTLLESARAEQARAELDLERMVARAPFDGALVDRAVEVGDYVSPGDPLFTYLDDRTLIVAGDVSEKDMSYLQVGMAGVARLVDSTELRGRVRYIAPLANAATRTFTVELEVDNGDGRAPLGATAQLTLALETMAAHAISPALLVLDDEGVLGLKVIDGDNRVQFVHVDIVRAEPDTVWVSGLPDPVRIITVGQGFVAEGERVAPQPQTRGSRTAADHAAPGAGRSMRRLVVASASKDSTS